LGWVAVVDRRSWSGPVDCIAPGAGCARASTGISRPLSSIDLIPELGIIASNRSTTGVSARLDLRRLVRGTVMKILPSLIAAVCVGVLPTTVSAQAGGAQANDDAACSAQATQQTGFDPSRPPPPSAQTNPQVAGSGSRARGAAAGAAIGAVGGDAGTGAAAGAVAGGVAQRSRNRRATRQANDTMAQQQQSGQAAWQQAKAACMANRGGAAQ
jgi:hypothetical protein